MAGESKVIQPAHIKLTITMLVSNRIDTIRQCMDSIDPLLKKIPSELIVVDTGSTDGSIEIVRQYTDKIVPFVWCSDFAKARNAGLQSARGEWVMFLDDDEWFEDIGEIIDFFESNEYQQYNRGVYLVRNYGDREGRSWTQTNAARMVKRLPNTEFIGRIHEYIGPQEGPSRYFSAYVHHYGYVFASEEERIKHSLRNVRLLEEEISHCPEDVRLLAHLVQEYYAIGEMQKALDICRRVMDMYRPQDRNYAGYCYNISLRTYIARKNWEQAYDWGKMLIEKGAPTRVALLGTIGEMISVCHNTEKYEEGLNCLNKYLELYAVLIKENYREETFSDLSKYLQEDEKEYIYAEGIALAVLAQDWKQAEKFFHAKDWRAVPLPLFKDTLNYVTELWTRTEFRREYAEVLDRVMGSSACRRQITENIARLARTDRKAYDALLRLFGSSRDESYESRKFRFLYFASIQEEEINPAVEASIKSSLEKRLSELWEEADNPLLWEREIWEAIGRRRLSVGRIVERLPLYQWSAQVRSWLETELETGNTKNEGDLVFENMETVYHAIVRGDNSTPQIQYLELKYREGILRKRFCAKQEDSLKTLADFSCRVLDFYGRIYRQDIIDECRTELLPPDAAFALSVQAALRCRQEGDLKAYMRHIAEAAKSYPVMADSCKVLLRIEEEDNQNRITRAEQMEFIQLAEQMKYKVRLLIDNGNYETAKQILAQLQVLIPEDEELEKIAQAVNACQGKYEH